MGEEVIFIPPYKKLSVLNPLIKKPHADTNGPPSNRGKSSTILPQAYANPPALNISRIFPLLFPHCYSALDVVTMRVPTNVSSIQIKH